MPVFAISHVFQVLLLCSHVTREGKVGGVRALFFPCKNAASTWIIQAEGFRHPLSAGAARKDLVPVVFRASERGGGTLGPLRTTCSREPVEDSNRCVRSRSSIKSSNGAPGRSDGCLIDSSQPSREEIRKSSAS